MLPWHMPVYLGVSLSSCLSSVTILKTEDGRLLESGVYIEERFTRRKHQGGFPLKSLLALRLDRPDLWAQLTSQNVTFTTFGEGPRATMQRWLRQKPLLKNFLDEFAIASPLHNVSAGICSHHDSHAYSALATTPPSEDLLILVMDGGGSARRTQGSTEAGLESISIYTCDGTNLSLLERRWHELEFTGIPGLNISTSLGGWFEAAATWIFGSPHEAGKVMGLASWGQPSPVEDRVSFLRSLGAEASPIPRGKMAFDSMPRELFSRASDLAATIQSHFEEAFAAEVERCRKLWPDKNRLTLVGGSALNCTFNGKLAGETDFESVTVGPFPSDDGTSYGAALAAVVRAEGQLPEGLGQAASVWGAWMNDADSVKLSDLENVFPDFTWSRPADLARSVAQLLSEEHIIAWVAGRSEVGPRALGHRSFLAHPGKVAMKNWLNSHVKFREDFRPYGAMTKAEWVEDFCMAPGTHGWEHMNFAFALKSEWSDKLSAIKHVDGTCRIQTLLPHDTLNGVLEEFRRMTGIPALLNTSLNMMGEPLVETLADVARTLGNGPVNNVVCGGYLGRRVQ